MHLFIRLTMWSQIIERSFTRELMRVFILLCHSENLDTSLDAFLTWISQIKDRFLLYVFKIIWCHLLPIETFRKGGFHDQADDFQNGIIFVRVQNIWLVTNPGQHRNKIWGVIPNH
jgi:hypothetical protein